MRPSLAFSGLEQRSIDQVSNALFYPRDSERFFQEGQRQIESETEILRRSPSTPAPTLDINEDIQQQQDDFQREQEQDINRNLHKRLVG